MRLYAKVNAWADSLEDRIAKLPGMAWFHYNTTGHPISWLQHTLFAAAFTATFWIFGYAALGAGIAFAAYVVREVVDGVEKHSALGFWPAFFVDRVKERPEYQKGWYVGWGVDGIMDTIGPGILWCLTVA